MSDEKTNENEETLEAAIEAALGADTTEEEKDTAPDEDLDGKEEDKSEGEDEGEKYHEKEEEEGEKGEKQETDEEELDDDKLIANLSERAQKRFRDLTQRLSEANERLQQWEEVISQTKASSEELAMLLEYSRLVHGTDEDKRKALQILEQERQALARQIGEPVPGVNLLDDHPDLKARVAEMEISEEDAIAIAKARNLEKRVQEQAQQQQQAEQKSQEEAQRVERALNQLDALGTQLKQQDPDYEAKIKILSEHTIPWIRENLPPESWAEAIAREYQMLSSVAAKPQPDQSPLRPTAGSGGGKKEPKSMEDAIAQALDGAA